jgi:glycosyltransferase involved in cell wall biosynthesis
VESQQNIALARNKSVQNAKGNFLAIIDDDEFPPNNWLLILYKALNKYKVDGILGPVKPCFEGTPPQWVLRGKFCEKPSHTTGTVLKWNDTRTSNVLLRKEIFNNSENKFNPLFGRGGEDKDFFRRMIEKGYIFIWCDEAPVYETIPSERCKRIFMLKRALLRGKVSLDYPSFGMLDIVKSFIAFFLYTLALPFFLLIGHHTFMKYLIKDFDHLGKLLAFCGFDVIKQNYVME